MTISYYSIRFLTGQLIDLAVEQHIKLMTPPLKASSLYPTELAPGMLDVKCCVHRECINIYFYTFRHSCWVDQQEWGVQLQSPARKLCRTFGISLSLSLLDTLLLIYFFNITSHIKSSSPLPYSPPAQHQLHLCPSTTPPNI